MMWKVQKELENSISIQKISITDLDTDIIVNAANDGLWAGSGVCGAIFRAAGHDKLQAACDAIGHCDTGSAVITPGFDLKAKYIVHAVGPVWNGGRNGEEALLKGAYTRSLELAYENECHSIGFPLISAGVFGYPLDDAWRVAIQACRAFFEKNPECEIKVVFAVLDERIMAVGQKELDKKPVADAAKDDVSKRKRGKFDRLHISGKEVDVVFFHKPEEPDGYLSNWYISPFDLDGIHYTSTEQYIMYQKCIVFGDKESAEAVLATNDTGKQQEIGRNAGGYIGKVWEGMRQVVAMRGLYAKFSQNPELLQKLLDTGNAYLVECAHSDVTWACGRTLDSDEKRYADKWLGQNILGFALMEVRAGLRAHKSGE